MQIQLALQGGGARIVSLLGAASAIQQLRNPKRMSKQLLITRVMGTSAGAIVGAMIAADLNIEEFRAKLLGTYRLSLLRDLRQTWFFPNIRQALFGLPYWRSNALREILRSTFHSVGVRTVRDVLDKCGVDLRIVATDLSMQGPLVFASSNDQGKELIEEALLHSCAIPLYFRSWQHKNSIVDGGIVQNFPCEELLDLEQSSGKAFGISFESHAQARSSDLKSYAVSLLDSAMENTTREAKRKLDRRIFELPFRYETFDFQGALSDEGLGEHFDRCKELALGWFEERIEYPHTYITEDFWSNQNRDTSDGLVKLYKVHENDCKIVYSELSMAVTAYGLSDSRLPDRTVTRLTFSTTSEKMLFHRVSLSESNTVSSLKSSNIRLTDWKQREIGITILPMIDRSTRERKELLIVFDESLPANSGPYTLVVVDSVLGLTGLLASGCDDVTTNGDRTLQPITRCEVIIHLPSRLRDRYSIRAVTTAGIEVQGTQFKPPWNPDKHEEGFFSIGWEGYGVLPGQDFGFSLELQL